jgi:tRNA(Arg) A34 adenosine deaminase TadA
MLMTDEERMESLVAFAREGFETTHPSPFAAEVVNTATGDSLVRYRNGIPFEHDPTAHAEVGVIRLATKKLQRTNLKGYTLYTTIHPCPMCMAACLWAALDRVVHGVTIDNPEKGESPLFGPYSADWLESVCAFNCQVDGPVAIDLTRALVDDPVVAKYRELCHEHDLRI